MPTKNIGKYTSGKLRAKYEKGGKVKKASSKPNSFRKNGKSGKGSGGELCGYNQHT